MLTKTLKIQEKLRNVTFFLLGKHRKKPRHRKNKRLCKNIMQDISLTNLVFYYEHLNEVSPPKQAQKHQQKQEKQQSQPSTSKKKSNKDRGPTKNKKNGTNKTTNRVSRKF